MPKNWGNSFNFLMPDGVNEESRAKFMEDNKQHFNDIEQFMMIVKDWFEGVIHDYDEVQARNATGQTTNSNEKAGETVDNE